MGLEVSSKSQENNISGRKNNMSADPDFKKR